jgi:hypothetical protein
MDPILGEVKPFRSQDLVVRVFFVFAKELNRAGVATDFYVAMQRIARGWDLCGVCGLLNRRAFADGRHGNSLLGEAGAHGGPGRAMAMVSGGWSQLIKNGVAFRPLADKLLTMKTELVVRWDNRTGALNDFPEPGLGGIVLRSAAFPYGKRRLVLVF